MAPPTNPTADSTIDMSAFSTAKAGDCLSAEMTVYQILKTKKRKEMKLI
jgi:hypothetical protein